jgi:hypothetical protein
VLWHGVNSEPLAVSRLAGKSSVQNGIVVRFLNCRLHISLHIPSVPIESPDLMDYPAKCGDPKRDLAKSPG